jgi:hypothetical protein
MARLREYGITSDGLVESVVVGEHRGHEIELRFYADDAVTVKHLCDRRHGERPDVAPHCVLTAPALVLGPNRDKGRGGARHVLRRDDDGAVWVEPSIRCGDCDLHGHVQGSRWRSAG